MMTKLMPLMSPVRRMTVLLKVGYMEHSLRKSLHSELFIHNTIGMESLEEVFAQDTKDRERSPITELHICRKENMSIQHDLNCLKESAMNSILFKNQIQTMTKSVG